MIFAFLVPSSAHFRVCPSVPQSFPGVVSACRDYAFHFVLCFRGLRASLVAQLVENLPAVRATWDRSWVEKIPWRRETLPTPVFWPGELHGLYSPLGRKESDTTERLSLSLSKASPLGRMIREGLLNEKSQLTHTEQRS